MKIIEKMNDLIGEDNIKSIDDWKNINIKTKKDLSESVVPKKFIELRITSGSTGKPLYVFYSKEAVEGFIRRTRKSIKLSGVSKNDIVLNLFAYGNYVPGSMYERACLLEGISVLPLGAPNTYPKEKIMEVILKIKPTVWFSVPSYAIGLLEVLNKINSEIMPKKVIVAGEMLLDSYISRFKELGVEIINHFGLTECPAIGISKKKDPKLIKVINDGIYAEAIEKDKTIGLAITDLNNKATPIIRYNTGDVLKNIKYADDGSLKEFSIIGRSDDLIKLQGILTSKTKIEDTLSRYTHEFIVNFKTKENRDYAEFILPSGFKDKEKEINEDLSFILAKKEFVFQDKIDVPKTNSQKLRHIVDLRK
jgi:phenylacetate-CoA ligase